MIRKHSTVMQPRLYFLLNRFDVALNFWTCVLEVAGSKLGQDTDYPKWVFQFSHANVEIYFQIFHDRLLKNSYLSLFMVIF